MESERLGAIIVQHNNLSTLFHYFSVLLNVVIWSDQVAINRISNGLSASRIRGLISRRVMAVSQIVAQGDRELSKSKFCNQNQLKKHISTLNFSVNLPASVRSARPFRRALRSQGARLVGINV